MTTNSTINKKRILKNTGYLYLRMLLTIIVGLYASRVLLEKLGFEDYGIYYVVGGVIILFSFLSAALNSATQRFLSVELGRNNTERLSKVFGTSIYIYILLAVMVFVLAETVGLWFLNSQMNFPERRMKAVNWVYQITIITFILNTLRTPYNAGIISYERMSFYALTSIFEAVTKLLIIYLIDKSHIDKLIFYAILVMAVSFVLLIWSVLYCHKYFPYFRFIKNADKSCFKEMFSFSGWSLFGSFASVGASQGTNILLNIFCGVLINAGMGIANQVTNVVNQFVSNFQVAFQPQIVKGYSNNEIENVKKMVYLTSRMSFYLLFVISIPFFINADYILKLWLNDVPDYASAFTSYMLLSLLMETVSAPLYITVQATGKIKSYQIIVSILLLSNLAIGYILLKSGLNPISVVIVRCVITLVLLIYRVIVASKILNFNVFNYVKVVIIKLVIVSVTAYLFSYNLPKMIIIPQFIYIACTSITTLLIIFLIGLSRSEKNILYNMIRSKIKK